MSETPTIACVVVTFDAMPWIERCLESVAGVPVVVVDNGSTDGTVAFVHERVPAVELVASENRGLAAGWNRGIAETATEFVLLLNADAWLEEDALAALVAVARRHPKAAILAPRLRNTDGTLQRSVRGFPTAWRIATEYLYLRKLGRRTRVFNAFYGAGFPHDREREVEWAMGACMLVRSEALADVGPFDERYFLFSEEVDWARRAADRGWSVVFTPEAQCVHVGGAAHGGRLLRENVRGQLRYLSLHEGARSARRARRVMWLGIRLRGLVARGDRRRTLLEAARWLRSGPIESLLAPPSGR